MKTKAHSCVFKLTSANVPINRSICLPAPIKNTVSNQNHQAEPLANQNTLEALLFSIKFCLL